MDGFPQLDKLKAQIEVSAQRDWQAIWSRVLRDAKAAGVDISEIDKFKEDYRQLALNSYVRGAEMCYDMLAMHVVDFYRTHMLKAEKEEEPSPVN